MAYMENDTETLDSTNETVEETVETPSTETTEETPEVDVEQLQATNKKLFERAKKAEADLKILRSGGTVQTQPKVSPQPSNVEEVVLLANGMDESLLGELKAVAKARGITSLIKAQNDPIFVAVKEKFEKDARTKQASVGASRGSGGVKVQKNALTPGLTREEHMALAKA